MIEVSIIAVLGIIVGVALAFDIFSSIRYRKRYKRDYRDKDYF
jgi:hypothetical protein